MMTRIVVAATLVVVTGFVVTAAVQWVQRVDAGWVLVCETVPPPYRRQPEESATVAWRCVLPGSSSPDALRAGTAGRLSILTTVA